MAPVMNCSGGTLILGGCGVTKKQVRAVVLALALIALGPVFSGLVGNGLLVVGIGLIIRHTW